MSYTFGVECLSKVWDEFNPVFERHYAEMKDRLEGIGQTVSPYNPNVEAYKLASIEGRLIFFTVRKDGTPVGGSAVYVTRDMHNQDLIAQEDTVYILPEHRNGVGRKLVKEILSALKDAGVKRAYITATTDPRATKLWERMGFQHIADQMIFNF